MGLAKRRSLQLAPPCRGASCMASVLRDFAVDELIGRGTTGRVLRGRRRRDRQQVAVKLCEEAQSSRREFEILRRGAWSRWAS